MTKSCGTCVLCEKLSDDSWLCENVSGIEGWTCNCAPPLDEACENWSDNPADVIDKVQYDWDVEDYDIIDDVWED